MGGPNFSSVFMIKLLSEFEKEKNIIKAKAK